MLKFAHQQTKMPMNNVILSSIGFGELKKALAEVLVEQMPEILQHRPTPQPDEYLTVKEVMVILKKSRNTISYWTKEGFLQLHEFNNSKYYLKSEILAAGRRKK